MILIISLSTYIYILCKGFFVQRINISSLGQRKRSRYFYYLAVLLQLFCINIDRISENGGRLEGQLFQHLIIRFLRSWGQSLGISGLSPQAAIPTAAWTGEKALYAISPVTISHNIIPKLYTLLIHVSVMLSGSPAMIYNDQWSYN